MKKLFSLLSATLLGNALHAQFLKETHEQLNYKDFKGVLAPQLYSYSHLVSVPLHGHFIFLSGQSNWDSIGTLIGEGDFKRQLQRCLETIEKLLTAEVAHKSHIVIYPNDSLVGVSKPSVDCINSEMEATAL